MSTDAGTPRFPKLKRVPAYRVVAEALVEEVLQRRLPPGSQLPSETDLAEQFGVNRSTVRESVRLLEEAGLVQRRPQKRLVITRPSTDAVANQLTRSEEHTSELQSLMRISYAVFCLKKKKKHNTHDHV